jgi:hypothetical protein
MPDGSSSAAPVITPGPSDFNSNRIHRDGANGGAKQSERTLPTNHSAHLFTIQDGASYKIESPRVVQCAQTYVLATYTMRCSEEMRWPLHKVSPASSYK